MKEITTSDKINIMNATLSQSKTKQYNHRQCQSLFGYAASVHKRFNGKCQLCDCGGLGIDHFDLWRQMTVEHILGESDKGYPAAIKVSLLKRFPELSNQERNDLLIQIDELNTVTACQFCNSTTSRNNSQRRNSKNMAQLIENTAGTINDVLEAVRQEINHVLQVKRSEATWKLEAVRLGFINEVMSDYKDIPDRD